MVALGAVGTKEELGLEGSGIVTKVGSDVLDLRVGDRVMVSQVGIFKTTAVIPASRCLPIPEGLSLESGASLPCVYATAIYSLVTVGKLEKHQVCKSSASPPSANTCEVSSNSFCLWRCWTGSHRCLQEDWR